MGVFWTKIFFWGFFCLYQNPLQIAAGKEGYNNRRKVVCTGGMPPFSAVFPFLSFVVFFFPPLLLLFFCAVVIHFERLHMYSDGMRPFFGFSFMANAQSVSSVSNCITNFVNNRRINKNRIKNRIKKTE